MTTDHKAALFAAALICFMIACCITAVVSYKGPIVLSTEMNTNGFVEYLCLGRGCEDIR